MDVEFDVGGEFAKSQDCFDFAEVYAAAVAGGGEGSLEAEVVEVFADGHRADCFASLDADLTVG